MVYNFVLVCSVHIVWCSLYWIQCQHKIVKTKSEIVSKCIAYFAVSNIRKGKYRPATTTTDAAAVSQSGDPPWILKWAGLESSGQNLYS